MILFELLAQRLPYRLKGLPVHEVARVIQQQEPTRLGSIDAQYRGDVEIIVAKALEKEKTRRYPTARDFAGRYPALRAGRNHRRPARIGPLSISQVCAAKPGDCGRRARRDGGLDLGFDRHAPICAGGRAQRRDRPLHRNRPRYQTYRARVAAAAAALSDHDVTDAAHQLDEAPPELRGWEWHYLRSRLDDSSAMFSVKPGEITHLVGSPDEPRVVTYSNRVTRLLDLEGRELLSLTFPDPKTWVSLDLLASREPRIVRPDQDAIEVADQGGQTVMRLQGLAGMNPGPAVISLDGSKLALGWSTSQHWEMTVHPLNGNDRSVVRIDPTTFTWSLSFSPDGSRVASAGEDGVTRIWNSTTGAKVAECRGHRSKVLHVSFRSDGKRLLTTSADGTVRQWDPADGHEAVPPYERHTGEVMTAAYSPNGQWVASGGTDRTIRVWRADDRQDRAVLHGHTAFIKELAFDADGRRVISTSSSFGSQGNDGDSTVRIWDLSDDGFPVLRGHTSYVYPVAYSPDGQWIATGSWDHTARLWNAQTGEHCATLVHKGTVRALAFGPDSSWLVSTSDGEERLQVWDVVTARQRREIQGTGKFAIAVAISPDGNQVASADQYGAVSASTTATGTNIVSLRGGGEWRAKTALAYSLDGRRLAGTGDDLATIAIWDAQSHQRTGHFEGHTGPVYSVAFNADGHRLASASSDHTVRVWNADTGECVAVLQGHTDEVLAAVFHPDGTRLVSAGRDRAVWFWDLATSQEVARLTGHTDYVFSLAFSPDGTSLVSGSGDGTARIWDLLPRETHQKARREADALRAEAERLVKNLLRTKNNDSEGVVAAIREDRSLSERQHHAAFRAVLRRSAATARTPVETHPMSDR